MKQWKCIVCGHVNSGNEPPEVCPVCGAPASKFVLCTDEDNESESQYAQAKRASARAKDAGEFDVVVVGGGAAAYAAAITAHQMGLSVVMLEKAHETGGTTARSGGALWIPHNRHQSKAGIVDKLEDALHYMARFSYPHLYDADEERLGLPKREYQLLAAYSDNAAEMLDFFEKNAVFETVMQINWTGKPQVDYMNHLPENKEVRGRTIYTLDDKGESAAGYNLVARCKAWAKAHDIPVYLLHKVVQLMREDSGRVLGVVALSDGKRNLFKAKRGVIFGTGGYSHNAEFMLSFQRGPHFGGCAVPTNTGDFIKLAGAEGAALGNMAGAFRAQSMIEVHLDNPDGSSSAFYLPGDSMMVVNKYGKRIMDEKRDYSDRAMTHFVWDPVAAEWTNMLQFLIYDARAADLWQGYPPYPLPSKKPPYLISGDTWEELARGIEERLEQLAPHTGGFALAADFVGNLKESVARFNGFAQAGKDEDFNRGDQAYDRELTTFPPTKEGAEWPDSSTKNYTMFPLRNEGPYYAVVLAAGTLDTNGGPVIDEHARVLDWSGEVIPGLYGAGNCIASPAANSYWGAGATIGLAMTYGYLAAKHIAQG